MLLAQGSSQPLKNRRDLLLESKSFTGMIKIKTEMFNHVTSGNDLFPAITKNSMTLSTHPESDCSFSITGNNLQQTKEDVS